jgi:hypothetical protein
VFAEVTAVRTCEVAEAAFMRLFPVVQRGDVRLQLRMCRGCVAAAVADVRALACVCALVVVFGLVGCEGFGARGKAAGVGAVAGMAEQVPRELGALLEVFCRGGAGVPETKTRSRVINVRGLGVRVECGGSREGG